MRDCDTPGLRLIGLGTVYIAPKILVLVSVKGKGPSNLESYG